MATTKRSTAGVGGRQSELQAKIPSLIEQAIIVTQTFHLPRALYLCNQLGLSVTGIPAERRWYDPGTLLYWNMRDLPATLVAMWEVNVSHPLPVLGKPEPIFPPVKTLDRNNTCN